MNDKTQYTNTATGSVDQLSEYITYSKESGDLISSHKSEDEAEQAARKIDPSLRTIGIKRIK